VSDRSQGVKLATMRELASYWETKYDWRKVETKLNALPQFVTNIDGLDIHFIYIRSKHQNALPHHALLADEHGGLLGPPLLGEQAQLLRPETGRHPGRRERLPGRDLCSPAELGGESISHTESFQPAP